MKTIVEDYLSSRLPANQNFIKHINGEMNSSLIMYLATIFTETNKAYVLSGLEVDSSNINRIGISAGVVFYNNELFYVESKDFDASQLHTQIVLSAITTTTTEEYGNGSTLPAYRTKTLQLQQKTIVLHSDIRFDTLIRRDTYTREIVLPTYHIKKEATITANPSTQQLIIHSKVDLRVSGRPAVIETGFEKQGFLGYCKCIVDAQNTVDLAVYQIDKNTVFAAIGGNEIINSGQFLTWNDIFSSIFSYYFTEFTLYLNLTHNRT